MICFHITQESKIKCNNTFYVFEIKESLYTLYQNVPGGKVMISNAYIRKTNHKSIM